MTPRSPEYNNDDILAYEARQHLPLQRVISNNMRSRPRTVGTTLGPRDGGVQKRGAKVSPLAAVRDLMPYHQYRARQRRDAGLGESVWDDELEDAFMEADANIPKIGRTKYNCDGKLRGRNELIADYIFRVTGKRRSRKQVSSHIQVLKNLLKNNPDITKHHASDPADWDEDQQSPSSCSTSLATRTPSMSPQRPHSVMAGYPDASFVSPPLSSCEGRRSFSNANIELTELSMFTYPRGPLGRDYPQHTYTRLSQNELKQPTWNLYTIDTWKKRFPRMNEIVEEELSSGSRLPSSNCPILHITASLATPLPGASNNNDHQTLFSANIELSIPEGPHEDHIWKCNTRIYAGGQEVRGVPDTNKTAETPLRVTGPDIYGSRRLKVPFSDEFWHDYLRSPGYGDVPVGNLVENLTAVQEITSWPMHSTQAQHSQLSVVLLWEFKKAAFGSKEGKAVYRQVIRGSTPFATGNSAASVGHFDRILPLDTVAANTNDPWTTPEQSRLPPSPYEDLSPGHVNNLAYYTYGGNTYHALPSQDASTHGLAGPLLQSPETDIANMGYFGIGQHSSGYGAHHQQFLLPGIAAGSLDNSYGKGGNRGGDISGAAWAQHLSPVSDRQGPETDDNGNLLPF
ncbi:Similar to Regulatory protein abaA; acc. no. P20945 [Pyronema omphalodes CBS 100304]|uniref:Similar to Regulatory protein abaA acc. no. P20945 n=1 Tax=Pyronema omphalodes (strain CBS 100304) TaxID=1076935 RepID=U4LEL5_PYROM|nr:Similar to Regulatory protein abaA; acc. no. P20945 [Pyronema omphalodes CBS 100304]